MEVGKDLKQKKREYYRDYYIRNREVILEKNAATPEELRLVASWMDKEMAARRGS